MKNRNMSNLKVDNQQIISPVPVQNQNGIKSVKNGQERSLNKNSVVAQSLNEGLNKANDRLSLLRSKQ